MQYVQKVYENATNNANLYLHSDMESLGLAFGVFLAENVTSGDW